MNAERCGPHLYRSVADRIADADVRAQCEDAPEDDRLGPLAVVNWRYLLPSTEPNPHAFFVDTEAVDEPSEGRHPRDW
jgi:hypothetical protein